MLKKIVLGILAVFGGLFILVMLIPDEWVSTDSSSDTSSSYESEENSDDDSYSETPFSSTVSTINLEGLREKKDYSNAKNATILVYMNGSDLESESGEATEDIAEMVQAKYSDNVNIIIQTMGTKNWQKRWGISSKHSQRYKVVEDGLELVDDSLSQLDCTDGRTLIDFINWGVKTYPADRYILQMWDHGGGPVYGFGYDEFQGDDAALTVAEMRYAIAQTGVFFDFIGMDCCIMSNIETCCALYDAADYMILSEDFESGLGWSYTGWLNAISKNPAIPTVDLAKIAIDDFVESNENDEGGDTGILTLIDESVMKVLYSAWTDFAYANESTLLASNYSEKVIRKKGGRILPRMDRGGFFDSWGEEDVNMADYYVTDIMAVAQNIDSEEKEALSSALANAIVYSKNTSTNTLTGLSVTLPYGDSDFYVQLKDVFSKCGIDESYISWLEKFVSSSGSDSFYNYSDWEDDWSGWDSYEDDYNWNDWDSEYYEDDSMGNWCQDGSCSYNNYSYDEQNDYYYYDDSYSYDDSDYDDDYYYDDGEFDQAFDEWWDYMFGY